MTDKYSFDKYKVSEYGPYKDEDGAKYEDAGSWLAYRELKLCGCGMPEDALEFVTALLVLKESLSNAPEDASEWAKAYGEFIEKKDSLFENYKEAIEGIIFNWLNSLGIMDHGGNVYGSWVLDKDFFDDCCRWFHEKGEKE